jgi:hypothetical protein
MVAPMIIASGVQAALGAYGAIRGSKSAKAAKKEAAAAQAKKMENLGQTLDYQKQLYGKFEALYNPMAKEAQSSKSYGYDQSSAELQKQYANAQKNIAESQGLGGIAAGASRQAQFGLATGLAQKYSEGTQLRDQMRMKLMGEPIKQGQYVAGAMDNISGAYGEQYKSAREDQAAGEKAFAAGLKEVGSALGSGIGSMKEGGGGDKDDSIMKPDDLDTLPKRSTFGDGNFAMPKTVSTPSGLTHTSTSNGTTTTGKIN